MRLMARLRPRISALLALCVGVGGSEGGGARGRALMDLVNPAIVDFTHTADHGKLMHDWFPVGSTAEQQQRDGYEWYMIGPALALLLVYSGMMVVLFFKNLIAEQKKSGASFVKTPRAVVELVRRQTGI